MLKQTFSMIIPSCFLVIMSLSINVYSMDPMLEEEGEFNAENALDRLEQEQERIANCLLRNFRKISYNDCMHFHQDHQLYINEKVINKIDRENDKNKKDISAFLAKQTELDEKTRISLLRKIQKKINRVLLRIYNYNSDVRSEGKENIIWAIRSVKNIFEKNNRTLAEKFNTCYHIYHDDKVPQANINDAQHCPFCEGSQVLPNKRYLKKYKDLYIEEGGYPGDNSSIFWSATKIIGFCACTAFVIYLISKTFNK